MRILLAFALACGTAQGQSTEAAISGIVTDPHGAFVPNVEVAAVQTATGVKTTVHSNETGFYSIGPLPIGPYTLTAEANGFRRFTEPGIVLTTGQMFEVNIRLEIGQVSETVTVSASGTLLETRTSDASQLIESKAIEDMPLGDRRAMNIIEITGAAVFGGYDSGSKPNFSLAGGRMQSQMFFIDGANAQNMRVGTGQMDLDPPIDTLQEVKVMSNGFSAEFGGSAGGGVIATTKSGTNQIRGSLSEYLRNEAMDAPNFFSPIVNGQKQKPSLRYNVFGGTVGGPIRHDKTFFFFAYEGSRRRDGSVRTLTVPSLLERSGDFSQTFNTRGQLYPIYDPFTNPRVVFPGNLIPKSRFDSVALNIVPIYPLPNRAPDDAGGANNFRANDVNAYTRNNLIGKVDHNLGNNDKLTFRYIYNSDANRQHSVFPVPAADPINDTDAHQQYWYATWTRIISPTVVNDLRFNYGRRYYRTFNKGTGAGWPSQLGLTGVPDNAFPTVVTAGYTNLGSGTQDRQQFPIQQYNLLESVTMVRGRHTVKAGAEVRPSLNHDLLLSSISGKYTFNRGLSGLTGNAQSGNGLATMLLGALSNFDQQATPVLNRRMWYLAGYVQDDWTVRPGLTLNFGVRWETDTPITDADNHMNGFDPSRINPVSGTPGVVTFLGLNGTPQQPYRGDYNNFGPRVGFAWKPARLRDTVVRGGFGIFYAHPFDGTEANTATLGFAQSSALVVQDNTALVPYTLGGGLPIQKLTSPMLNDSFGAVPVGQTATTTVTYLDPSRRTGYSEQFNLSIQRELPGAILVEIGYLGNLSRKLPGANIGIDQIRPELLTPTAQQKNRPYPQFSGVTILAPAFGVSSYNAGMAKVERRFAKGFSILATYTWSKFLDNTGGGPGSHLGDNGGAYSNYYNRRADWGPSDNDIRHRLTWSSVYQIPVGAGRQFFNSGPLRNVIGGWQLGLVMALQTGPPTTVQTQTNTTYAYSSGAQRADVLRNPNLASGQTLNHWFDTDAFAQPATNQFGNQGVGLVRADGIFNVNTSVIRAFRLAERKTLQFRGEFFNLPNHPNFLVPGHTFNGPGFGIVSAARPARQVQLGLRLTF
jgi:hypothetical protein